MARGGLERPPRWAVVVMVVGLTAVVALSVALTARDSASSAQAGSEARNASTATSAAPSAAPVTFPGPGASVLVIGDSYSTGYGATDPTSQGYVAQLAQRYGWQVTTRSFPGGGYVKKPSKGDGPFSLAVASIGSPPPQAVVIEGGLNDAGEDPGAVGSAASSLYGAIHQKAPGVPILVVGMLTPTVPTGQAVSVRDAIRSAATRQPETLYVDTSGLRYPTISDAVHPTTEGYASISGWIEQAIESVGAAKPAA